MGGGYRLPELGNLCYEEFMGALETELEMVRRHVREGEQHLVNQRALIARLWASHLPTEAAEALLDTFKDMQRQHEDHLARLEGK